MTHFATNTKHNMTQHTQATKPLPEPGTDNPTQHLHFTEEMERPRGQMAHQLNYVFILIPGLPCSSKFPEQR